MTKREQIKGMANYIGTTQAAVERCYAGLVPIVKTADNGWTKYVDGIVIGAVLDATPDRRLAARDAAHASNPRKQNWRSVECRWRACEDGEIYTTSVPARGGWSSWEYTPVMQSQLRVSDDMLTATYTVGQSNPDVFVRKAPKGMQFCPDEYGIALRRLSDGMEFHPTAEDFEAPNFATRCRKAMTANWRARRKAAKAAKIQAKADKEQARLHAIREREIAKCRVTLYDSQKAGNCIEGSLRFAETRLHLDRNSILAAPWLVTVSAAKLLAMGEPKAKAAAIQAWMRETTISI